MDTMDINVRSWHFYIAKEWGDFSFYQHKDICAYRKRILVGIAYLMPVVAFVAAIAAFFFYLLGSTAWWVIQMIQAHAFIKPTDGAAILVMTLGVMAMVVALVLAQGGYKKLMRRRSAPRSPGVVGEMWSSFKNKYCVQLRFVDPKQDGRVITDSYELRGGQ